MSFFKKMKMAFHHGAAPTVVDGRKRSSGADQETLNEEGQMVDKNVRALTIFHIDAETEGSFAIAVKNDDSGETLLDRVCDHYQLHEYKEYFGLKYTLVDEHGDHEIFWLDPLKSVGKQLRDTNNMLTFRVKHFPGQPALVESEYVRYLMFLQIRNYLLKGDLQLVPLVEARLAAYAIQAAIGDYDDAVEQHQQRQLALGIVGGGSYLTELKFLSRKSLRQEQDISELHKKMSGKTPSEMELAFLIEASQFDTYGAELIVVRNSKDVAINFGVSHNGVITYLHGTTTARVELHPWNQIGKISCQGRKLYVHVHSPDNRNFEIFKKHVMVFKCNSSRICKHLWKFILDQRAFFNFKRGVDVPQLKSSSGLFTLRKSKFRFSGRCENELIASQHTSPPGISATLPVGTVPPTTSAAAAAAVSDKIPPSASTLNATLPGSPNTSFLHNTTAPLSNDTSFDGSQSLTRPFVRRTFVQPNRSSLFSRAATVSSTKSPPPVPEVAVVANTPSPGASPSGSPGLQLEPKFKKQHKKLDSNYSVGSFDFDNKYDFQARQQALILSERTSTPTPHPPHKQQSSLSIGSTASARHAQEVPGKEDINNNNVSNNSDNLQAAPSAASDADNNKQQPEVSFSIKGDEGDEEEEEQQQQPSKPDILQQFLHELKKPDDDGEEAAQKPAQNIVSEKSDEIGELEKALLLKEAQQQQQGEEQHHPVAARPAKSRFFVRLRKALLVVFLALIVLMLVLHFECKYENASEQPPRPCNQRRMLVLLRKHIYWGLDALHYLLVLVSFDQLPVPCVTNSTSKYLIEPVFTWLLDHLPPDDVAVA